MSDAAGIPPRRPSAAVACKPVSRSLPWCQERSCRVPARPGAYRGGALLAFRYAEEFVFRKAIAEEIESAVVGAVSAVRDLQGIQLPDVALCGGAADFWLFSERPERVSKFDTLRAFFCLGLQVQHQLAAYGAVPAFLLDWEDDATYLSSLKSRTILSGRLRSAHDALLGSQPAHILLSDNCRRSLSVVSGAVQSPLLADLVATLDSPSADLSCSVEELPAPISSKTGIPMAAVSYSVGPEVVAGSSSAYTEYAAIQHRENRSGVRPGESFIQLLADADECMIIGITNEHLAENYLIPALAERRARGKKFWGRLVVVFPSFKSTPLYVEGRTADDRVHRRASGLRTVISLLKSEVPQGSHGRSPSTRETCRSPARGRAADPETTESAFRRYCRAATSTRRSR